MDAYVIDGVFTPRASVRKGISAYSAIHPQELVATCFKTLAERQKEIFSQVTGAYIGCVTQVNDQGANLARNAVLTAGLPQTISAASLNMCCGSGLETVNLAAASVSAGNDRLALAGGVESMSRVKMASDGGGMDGNNQTLRQAFIQVPQGISADYLAATEAVSREQLDFFALESHQKATTAQHAGYFRDSYALVKNESVVPLLTEEDHIRIDASLDALQKLPPAFVKLGEELAGLGIIGEGKSIPIVPHVHTAGTSSGIADGASTVLLAGGNIVKDLNLKPRARILGTRSIGSDPISMLTGPADCCAALLKACGMTVADVDLWEINEAFAIVPIQTMRRLGISPEKINIKGGSIARGHPLGATGAILLTSVISELEKENLSIGCAVLCVAGGQSVATLVERC